MNLIQGKRILVTGAAGFVGANLVRALLDGGAEVHALIRPSTDPWRLRDVAPGLIFHHVDLVAREALRKLVEEVRPEVVFHLARSGPAGAREAMLGTNVLGTANLLDACAGGTVRRFIQAGSSLEYGKRKEAIRESDSPDPETFFGATKAAGTLLSRQAAKESGFPAVVLRLFSVYGPWEAPSRLIPTAIHAALGGGVLDLTEPGYRRDLVFVEDVVEALLLAAGAERAAGEVINIGSGRQASNEEVVEMIQAVTGRCIRVRVGAYPARLTDTTDWVADNRKAERLLGWRPRHALEDGISQTVSWFHERGTPCPAASPRENQVEEAVAQADE